MLSLGYTFDWYEDGHFYGRGKDFFIRGEPNGYFLVGIGETFNKWGDSRDYEGKYPKTLKEFDKIFEDIGKLKRCENKDGKHQCSEWLKPSEQTKVRNKVLCDWHVEQLNKRIRKKNKGHSRRNA